MARTIFEAASEGDTGRIRVLLDQDPGLVHQRDELQGWTALHFAASDRRLAAARLLLERGAEATAPAKLDEAIGGETPLHLTGDEEMVRMLLRFGGNPTLADSDGMTPLDWAFDGRDFGLFRLLAEGAPQAGSHAYQFLGEVHSRRLAMGAEYLGFKRFFVIARLARSAGGERCLAWQWTAPCGWQIYVVSGLTRLSPDFHGEYGIPEDAGPVPALQ